MARSNLEVLRDLEGIAKELKKTRMSPGYWEKEAKFLDKLNERNEIESELIRGTYEDYLKFGIKGDICLKLKDIYFTHTK